MGCCNGISLNQVESATAIYDDLNSSAFLKELKCGSLQALEHLDRTLTPHLIGFLRFAMDVPEADAEELVSDALFAVTSHVHTFQPGGPAKLTVLAQPEMEKRRFPLVKTQAWVALSVYVLADSGGW